MKFWVRENGSSPFQGPFTLSEVATALRAGQLSGGCELLRAEGQSFGALKRATGWRPARDFDLSGGPGAGSNKDGPAPTGTPASADMSQFLMARGLVLVLRALAVLAALWGLMSVVSASRAAHAAAQAAKASGGMAVPQNTVAQAADRAGAMAVFTAALVGLMLVAVPLVLAEGLRLAITIEGNTRKTAQALRKVAEESHKAEHRPMPNQPFPQTGTD
jgi:hypothetical protein